MGAEFQLRKMTNVPEVDGGGCTTMGMYLMPLNYALKMIKMVNFVMHILPPKNIFAEAKVIVRLREMYLYWLCHCNLCHLGSQLTSLCLISLFLICKVG